MDNSKETLIHAVKATELNPNDGAAWHYRGVLEAKRADFPAAIESQTRSLKLGETLDALRARENCERRIGQIGESGRGPETHPRIGADERMKQAIAILFSACVGLANLHSAPDEERSNAKFAGIRPVADRTRAAW